MAEKRTPALLIEDNRYCPGCGHGIINRVLAEVLEEMGLAEEAVISLAVGCGGLMMYSFGTDWIQAPHGRAAAVATGFKRVRPKNCVIAYQGDGDALAIGFSETMYAAIRNENITAIIVNNGIYGMTGGQLAPTTLVGMKATTAPKGRDPKEHGYPMHMCEILNQLEAPVYLERCSCNTPQNVVKTKKAVKKAFQNQIDGKGFSMVEIVTSCPTNWGMDPLGALDFLEEKMLAEFPLGVYRDRTKEA